MNTSVIIGLGGIAISIVGWFVVRRFNSHSATNEKRAIFRSYIETIIRDFEMQHPCELQAVYARGHLIDWLAFKEQTKAVRPYIRDRDRAIFDGTCDACASVGFGTYQEVAKNEKAKALLLKRMKRIRQLAR